MSGIYTPGRSGSMGISSSPLDPSRCKQAVWSRERWATYSQCARKAGKDGWCKQHHPDAKKLRDEAARERDVKRIDRAAFGWNGGIMIGALRKIADGDNDPRATAQEALKCCGLATPNPERLNAGEPA